MPRLARRCGLMWRIHAHALRHTHAADLAIAGVPLLAIQQQLGHASLSTTSDYPCEDRGAVADGGGGETEPRRRSAKRLVGTNLVPGSVELLFGKRWAQRAARSSEVEGSKTGHTVTVGGRLSPARSAERLRLPGYRTRFDPMSPDVPRGTDQVSHPLDRVVGQLHNEQRCPPWIHVTYSRPTARCPTLSCSRVARTSSTDSST